MSEAVWLNRLQGLVDVIRNEEGWTAFPLQLMRRTTGSELEGALMLYAYSKYVSRFILIMCDVLSKAPSVDERFWRLAENLHDELGGQGGLGKAHAKLIERATERPREVPEETWDRCVSPISGLEQDMFLHFTSLPWPLNLFALGPGTESISDLFLEPIENWSAQAVLTKPRVQVYFDVHRPEVEASHQLEICNVLATELASMSIKGARALFEEGSKVAQNTASKHLNAVVICWSLAQSFSAEKMPG